MPDDMMKVKEVADTFGYCTHTIYRMSKRGEIPRVAYGKRWRWPRAVIMRMAEEGFGSKRGAA